MREEIEQLIRNEVAKLTCPSSPYGDWKNLKQLDTGCYTEEEMTEYRQGRESIRQRINELQEELESIAEAEEESEEKIVEETVEESEEQYESIVE